MNRTIWTYAILLLTSCDININQKSANENQASFEDNLSYFEYTNSAELEILESNYSNALMYYDSAFEIKATHYTKDLHNATVCAIKENKLPLAQEYIMRLFNKGVPISQLEESLAFENLRHSAIWNDITQEYYKKKNNFASSIDVATKQAIDTLHELDQCFRRKDRTYAIYNDTIQSLDSYTIQRLIGIIETKDYPTEDNIGTDNFRGYLPHNIVIHHAIQNGNNVFYPHITKALKEGKIHPFFYASFIDLGEGDFAGVYGSNVFPLEDGEIHKEYDSIMEIEINVNRKNIGLESLEEYNKKVMYSLKNNDFVFLTGINLLFQQLSIKTPIDDSDS